MEPLGQGETVDNSMSKLTESELDKLISAIAEVIEEQYGYGEGEEFITPCSTIGAIVLAKSAVALWRQRSPCLSSEQDSELKPKVD